MAGDGHAMGVSSQVAENVFRAAEGWLAIDNPVVDEQPPQEAAKMLGSSDLLKGAVELKLVAPEELSESSRELAAEYAAERDDRQEEAGRGIDPSGTVGSQAAGGNDVMHVRVMLKVLAPGVQYSEEADLGSEVLRIARHLKHGFGAGRVEQIIDDSLVAEGQCGKFMGECEDNVEAGYGQQFCRAGSKPLGTSVPLTPGTVPVPTRVV